MNKAFTTIVLLFLLMDSPAQEIKRSGHASIRTMCISKKKKLKAATNHELYEIQVVNQDSTWGVNIGAKTGGIRALSFSEDEERISLGTYTGVLEVWQLQGPNKLYSKQLHNGQLNDVCHSIDGEKIVTAGNDGIINVLNSQSYVIENTINCQEKIIALDRHPTQKDLMVAVSHNGEILWIDIENGDIKNRLQGHADHIYDVVVDNEGHFMYTAGGDNLIKKWNVEHGSPVYVFNGHLKDVFSIDLSDDGRYLVSGSMDRTIKVFDVEQESEMATLNGHKDYVMVVRFISENLILSGSRDTTLRLWNIKMIKQNETGNSRATIRKHNFRGCPRSNR